MQKKQPKNFSKLGILLIGAFLLFTTCEKEASLEIENQQSSNYRIQELGYNQVMTNLKVVEKLKKFKPTSKNEDNSNLFREIYNEQYNFMINTDHVKFLENIETGHHSYNFPILRDSIQHNFVENLLLISNAENGYDAYLVKYDFTADEFLNIDESTLNNRTTEYYPIDFETSVFNEGELARYTMNVVCSEVWNFVGIVDPATFTITSYQWVLESRECTVIGGSGAGGTSNAGDTGSTNDGTNNNCNNCGASGTNGGTSSTNQDPEPIISAPATLSYEDMENCLTLKNLMKKSILNQTVPTRVKTLLVELDANVSTVNKEIGYFLTPENAAEQSFFPNFFEGQENADEVLLNLGTNAVSVIMHIHYNNEALFKKQLSVPSLPDLYQIYASINTGNIFMPNSFTFFVVTEHGTKYALQLNNSQEFLNSNLVTTFFANWDNSLVRDKAEDNFEKAKYYNISPERTNAQNELQFAKFLEGENLGFTLFKANDDFTQWSVIQYKNGIYTETPCN